jgi:hypothetical protein
MNSIRMEPTADLSICTHQIIHSAPLGPKGPPPLSFFYEIRSTTDTVLKRNGGLPDREAATEAAPADTKRLRSVPKPQQVARLLGQV